MRLNQLARQIGVEPKEVVKVLKKHDIEINDHPNTKLEDNQIEIATSALKKPEEVVEEVQPKKNLVASILDEPKASDDIPTPSSSDITQEESAVAEDIPDQPETSDQNDSNSATDTEGEISTENVKIEVESSEIETVVKPEGDSEVEIELTDSRSYKEALPSVEEIAASSDEVIKAPKVKLQGTKVVGKIDLPEDPKRKAIEEAQAAEKIEQEEEEALQGPFVHPNKIAKSASKIAEEERLKLAEEKAKSAQPVKKAEVKKEAVRGESRPTGKQRLKKTEKEAEYIPIWDPKRDESTASTKKNKQGSKTAVQQEQKSGFAKFLDWLFDRNSQY